MRFLPAALLTLLLIPLQASSASRRAPVLSIEQPSTPVLKPGSTIEIPILVSIADDLHVQANPASQENLIPLQLKLEAQPGLSMGQVVYPKGKPFQVKSTSKPLATYEGDIEVKASMTAERGAKPGDRELKGVARYQACTQETCLFPANQEFSILVRIGK